MNDMQSYQLITYVTGDKLAIKEPKAWLTGAKLVTYNIFCFCDVSE